MRLGVAERRPAVEQGAQRGVLPLRPFSVAALLLHHTPAVFLSLCASQTSEGRPVLTCQAPAPRSCLT